MRFIIDENIPSKVLRFLKESGHDVIRAPTSTTDFLIAELARREKRILITLDKDLTNTFIFPPSKFDIIHVHIHPPLKDRVCQAIAELLKELPPTKFKGLIILEKTGFIKIED